MTILVYPKREHAENLASWYRTRGTDATVKRKGKGFAVCLAHFGYVELVLGSCCPI